MRVGFLYSRIRKDEKLLLNELRDRGHDVQKIDVREQQFGLSEPKGDSEKVEELDIVLNRCMSTSKGIYATKMYESYGVNVFNSSRTAELCSDKLETSLALKQAGVPTPETEVAFSEESAMKVIERFGYPCVVKPVVGSWGRLLAKIDSRNTAEAVLEHKSTLGNYKHSIFYIQQFVDKPGRDIRAIVGDGEPIATITRNADHWITNTSRGAESEPFELDNEARQIVREASEAVGAGLVGVDMMESKKGYTVHEVNHGTEFRNIQRVTEVDVASKIIDLLENNVD